jgi:predicted nucleic acid-binding protein
MVLLDTDIAIDIVRDTAAAVLWVESITEVLGISGFTRIELLSGARSRAEQEKLQRTLQRFQVLWLSSAGCGAAVDTYADLRLRYGIGAFDCLIAHTAMELGVPLHTFNVKHFQHVPDLRTIQPYTR